MPDPAQNPEGREVLQLSAEHLARAQRLADLGCWEHDLTRHRLVWSDEAYRIFGIKPGAFDNTFEAYYALVHPDDRARLLAERNRGLERDGRLDLEHRIVRPDGEVRYVHERGEKITREDGAEVIAGTVQDITQRREAEEKLRRSETLLRIAGRTARLGGWSLELPSGKLHWSDEVCELHDVPRGTAPTLHDAFEYYAPEWRKPFADAAIDCMRKGTPFDVEAELITAKGRRVWVRSIGEAERDAEGTIRRVQGAVQDITLRKQAEEKAREVSLQLQSILDNSPFIICELDLEGHYLLVNRTFGELFGADPAAFIGKHFEEVVPGDFAGELADQMAAMRRNPVPLAREYTLTLDGDDYLFSVVQFPLFDRNGELTSIGAIAQDVTEREEAAAKARDVTMRLQGILDNSPVLICELDLDGRYLLVNRAVAELYGASAEQILGRSYHELLPPSAGEAFAERIAAMREHPAPVVVEDPIEFSGAIRRFMTFLFPLFDASGELMSIGAIAQDVTERAMAQEERERLEAQLRQAQKMEAVGRLAGGVAHDFNNMLSVILGYAELAMDELSETDPLRDSIGEILEAGRHSADLTRQLLAFARKQTVAPRVVNLNKAITRSTKMLSRLIGEDIELIWRPADDLWPVRIDPAQVDQILANLAVNARDAITGVGRITIETANVELKQKQLASYPGLTAGSYAQVTFSDTGCGMDPQTRDQAFEPFFTTKETGKGTGLGLATVYGILKQNHGFVYVESQPGEGTTLKIYLPRHLSEEGIEEAAADPDEPAQGRGTILLVEDEDPLMRLTARLISQLGYDVLPANSPEEALRLSSEFEAEIDLLLTDVVMPNLSGRNLWEILRKQRPGLKCLFMSGYTADIIADHGVLHHGLYFLQKPFTRHTLAGKIHEALAEGR